MNQCKTISLCLQPHLNMINEFKGLFTSFKRCWDKQRAVFLMITEEAIIIYSLSLNELMPEIETIFQAESARFIENMIFTPPDNELALTLQVVDFDGFVAMLNGLDNNLEDVRLFLEQQENIYLGCEVVKLDETKIQRMFETKILETREISICPKSQMDFVIASCDLAQMFNMANRFDSSVNLYFYVLQQAQQGLKVCLVNDQHPIITQYILPAGYEKQDLPTNYQQRFQVHHLFCSKVHEICCIDDIIQIGIHDDKLILTYFKEGVNKQFKVPQIEVMQSKLEYK